MEHSTDHHAVFSSTGQEFRCRHSRKSNRVLKPGGVPLLSAVVWADISPKKKNQKIKLALSENRIPKKCKQLITPEVMRQKPIKRRNWLKYMIMVTAPVTAAVMRHVGGNQEGKIKFTLAERR